MRRVNRDRDRDRDRGRDQDRDRDRVESYRGEDHLVRNVTGSAATKPYRCPGCHQSIRPATPHVVAWPVVPSSFARDATGLDERRHWHTHCWRTRDHSR